LITRHLIRIDLLFLKWGVPTNLSLYLAIPATGIPEANAFLYVYFGILTLETLATRPTLILNPLPDTWPKKQMPIECKKQNKSHRTAEKDFTP